MLITQKSTWTSRSAVALLLLLMLIPAASAGLRAENLARTHIDEMLVRLSKVFSLSARVKRLERLPDGSTISGEMQFKAMFEPRFKAYIHINAPKSGAEVLFIEGSNDDKAVVNPNGFPWINVNLEPEGSSMMENQHHSLKCLGFRFTEDIVRHLYKLHVADFDAHVIYMGVQKWNTRMTHVIKFSYDNYGPVKYTVKGDENLCEIERNTHVPAAKILDMNPNIADYWDVKAGQVINIPNYYGKESVFMIDTENYMPIVQIIKDEKGLFEKYEYHDVVVNPKFNTAEFTKTYPGYNF